MMLRPWLAASACMFLAACAAAEHSEPKGVVGSQTQSVGTAAAKPLTVLGPDGVIVHYDDQGQGGPTILFVHGWNCDRSYWDAQRDFFARKYRVVTLDLAGHGESTDNREAFTVPAFGSDVAAVAKALDLHDVVLVGHSMGGPVVVEAANQLQDRVVAVVGVDTLRNIGRPRSPSEVDELTAKTDADFIVDSRTSVAGLFVAQSNPELRDSIIKDMLSAPLRVAKSSISGLMNYDLIAAIRALRVPLVLINSDFLPTNLAPITAAAGEVQFIEMTGVGHFVMLEDPDTFNRDLDGVIQSLPARKGPAAAANRAVDFNWKEPRLVQSVGLRVRTESCTAQLRLGTT